MPPLPILHSAWDNLNAIPLVRRIVRFGIVGVTATAIHVSVALMLSGFAGLGGLAANFLGFSTAWSVSYLGNYYWTFLADSRHAVSVPRFMLTSLACLAASMAIVQWTTIDLGWPFYVSQIIVAITIPAISFILNVLWVFRPSSC
jgi:putative flippase GtrA